MGKEVKSDPRQIAIDWTRAQRLKFLDQVELPRAAGTSPAKMLAVLRCLESHQRERNQCRVKSETIAAKVNTTDRSVRRALAALEELGVIWRKRTGRSSIYGIAWANLQDLVPAVVAREETQLAEQTERGQTEHSMSDQSGHHVRSDRTPCPIRADAMSNQIGQDVRSTEAHFETNFEPPPPPVAGETAWREAEGAVAGCGVGKVREAVAEARAGGVDPEYVLGCVAIAQASGGAYGGGALVARLRQASPHVPPEAVHAWPPPKPLTARQAAAVRLLEAVQAAEPEIPAERLRTKFEAIGRTDPQRAPPEQAGIAAKFGCPFEPAELKRAWFQVHHLGAEKSLNHG